MQVHKVFLGSLPVYVSLGISSIVRVGRQQFISATLLIICKRENDYERCQYSKNSRESEH